MTFTRESGPHSRAIETALAEPPFAASVAAGAPVLVAIAQPPQILWSNEAARALFGADAGAIERRLFAGRDPGARRIGELARALVPGAGARLEKLRFFAGPRALMLTVLCRRTLGPQPLFILAVPDAAAPQRSAPAFPDLATPQAPPAPVTFAPEAPLEAPLQVVQALPADEPPQAIVAQPPAATPPVRPAPRPAAPVAPSFSAARRSAGEVAADLAERLQGSANVRFLWQTDAAHRFVKITGELCDLVGCVTSRLVGRSFLDLAEELALDPEHKLHDALLRGETWSGLEVLWPVDNADAAFPITLGGLPAHDRERRFEGFRGFGVIHVTRLQDLEEARPAPPDLPAPDDPVEEPPQLLIDDASLEAPTPAEEPPAPHVPVEPPVATDNVVALRPFLIVARRQEADASDLSGEPELAPEPESDGMVSLSASERLAFREIARALGARDRSEPSEVERLMPDSRERTRASVRDLIEVATRMGSDIAQPPVAPSVTPAVVTPVALEHFPAPVQAVLDRLPIGVLVSRDAQALFANRTLLDLLGYADAAQFMREDGLARMFRGRPHGALEADESGAVSVFARSGSPLPLEARIQMVDWDGAPASLMTFRRAQEQDFAQRIRALETDLRASEAGQRELHAILDTATDGVAVIDEAGRILSINRAGEALFGFEQNEVAGESFTILLARESQSAALEYLNGISSSGVASVLNDGRDVMGRARQGGAIPLFMTLGRIGGNGTQKFCAVLRDMTAWKKAEEELQEARRAAEQASALKSDFLAKISHEIRTPLNAILGFAEVIMEERFGPVGNERYKEYLQDIHASGSHVMSLVNDLLDLSKIEAGKLELDFGAVDANRIVGECVSLIQPQAARERVIVRLSLAPRLPNIVADERALRQIVLNLLSNAVKFNEAGGQVIVSTALTDAGHAVIRIRDTGIGMSESEIEMALEPFRRVATARATSGTGLGLPLTKALIEANRASFSIKSKKAEGTLVEVAFPPTRVLAE